MTTYYVPPDSLTEAVAEDLQGTCMKDVRGSAESLIEFYPKFKGMTADDVDEDAVSQLIYECNCCSWWCETGDVGEETPECGDVCSDCWRDNYAVDDDE